MSENILSRKICWEAFDIFRILPIVVDWIEQWPEKCRASRRLQDSSSASENSSEISFGKTSQLRRNFQKDQNSQQRTIIEKYVPRTYPYNHLSIFYQKTLSEPEIWSKYLMLTSDEKFKDLSVND